jgi:chemotaxis protein CheC
MKLTLEQIDVLKEVINIGVGKAASSLNQFLESHINLGVPTIRVMTPESAVMEYPDLLNDIISYVEMDFHGPFNGKAALLFPPESALELAKIVTGVDETSDSMNEMIAGSINEVGNIVINAIMGSLSNIIDKPIDFAIPLYIEGTIKTLFSNDNEATILIAKTHFDIQNRNIDGSIFIMFEVGSFDLLLKSLENY